MCEPETVKIIKICLKLLKIGVKFGKDSKLSNFFRNIGKNVVLLKPLSEEMMEINHHIS